MFLSLFIQITLMVWCFGGLLSIPLIMYAAMCKLFTKEKETQ